MQGLLTPLFKESVSMYCQPPVIPVQIWQSMRLTRLFAYKLAEQAFWEVILYMRDTFPYYS